MKIEVYLDDADQPFQVFVTVTFHVARRQPLAERAEREFVVRFLRIETEAASHPHRRAGRLWQRREGREPEERTEGDVRHAGGGGKTPGR